MHADQFLAAYIIQTEDIYFLCERRLGACCAYDSFGAIAA